MRQDVGPRKYIRQVGSSCLETVCCGQDKGQEDGREASYFALQSFRERPRAISRPTNFLRLESLE